MLGAVSGLLLGVVLVAPLGWRQSKQRSARAVGMRAQPIHQVDVMRGAVLPARLL